MMVCYGLNYLSAIQILFSNLRKADFADELECKGISTNHVNKTELQQWLPRPTALMCSYPT